VSTRESLWLTIDDEALRVVEAFAKLKNISRHEAARAILRLGIEILQRQREEARR
jgi:hypothetical protein